VSCSWDYLTRSAANLAFNYCLLGFEFVLPVSVIVLCYTGILVSVRRQGDELKDFQTRAALAHDQMTIDGTTWKTFRTSCNDYDS